MLTLVLMAGVLGQEDADRGNRVRNEFPCKLVSVDTKELHLSVLRDDFRGHARDTTPTPPATKPVKPKPTPVTVSVTATTNIHAMGSTTKLTLAQLEAMVVKTPDLPVVLTFAPPAKPTTPKPGVEPPLPITPVTEVIIEERTEPAKPKPKTKT